MPFTLRCPNPNCLHTAVVADAFRGRIVRCSHCKESFEAIDSPDLSTRDPLERFRIQRRLGSGAFGDVYLATDTQLQRDVALKVPRPGLLENPRQVERFLREGKAAAGLNHPHIVPVYDAGREKEHYYLSAAFIDGRTLAEEIDSVRFSPRRAATLVRSLAEAMAYAHGQGIIHRDVKPANVLLDGEGEPHLTDFGIAYRQEMSERLTVEGAVLGTPAYMAPEQAAGQQGEVKPAVDQYALGVMLYELLVGETPFRGPPAVVLYSVIHQEPEPPRRRNPAVPGDLETICLKAMAADPEKRYPSCQDLADDLRRWLDGEPIHGRRRGMGERFVRWVKKEPGLIALGIVSAVCLSLVSVVATNRAGELVQTRERTEELVAATREKARLAEEKAEEARKKAAQADRDAAEANTASKKAAEEREAARKARVEQERQTALFKQAEKEAREHELQARRTLYRARVELARKALDRGDRGRARALLLKDVPARGEEDVRDAAWKELMSKVGS